MPTMKELKEELSQEWEWTALHKKSVEDWMDIIREMEAEAEKAVDQESEWKTRYVDVCMRERERERDKSSSK